MTYFAMLKEINLSLERRRTRRDLLCTKMLCVRFPYHGVLCLPAVAETGCRPRLVASGCQVRELQNGVVFIFVMLMF